MEPVRYDLRLCDGDSGRCRAEMEESEDGDYVSYESYAAQAAEIARLKADVETERNRHRAWTDYFQTNQLTHAASRLEAAEDDRRRLKARVAELEAMLHDIIDSIPSTYDEEDPTVKRHAAALNVAWNSLKEVGHE